MVTRTLHFSAKLNTSTHRALTGFLTARQHFLNAALEERIGSYQQLGRSISAYDQCKSLTQLLADGPDFAAVSVAAQRSVLLRLHRAFKALFARVKGGREVGVPLVPVPAPGRALHRDRQLSRPSPSRLVFGIREGHRPLPVQGRGRRAAEAVAGRAPAATGGTAPGRREAGRTRRRRRAPLGIDVGVRFRAALSNSEIAPGQPLDRSCLKRRQRMLSRANRGSRSRAKKRLARAILEQTWGAFALMFSYKAEEAGGQVRRVPSHNTLQRCSRCGSFPDEKLGLSGRVCCCGICGCVEDRDVNAGKNIL